MKKMAHKPAEANRTFSVIRKMFNLAEVWADGTNPCRHMPMYPNGKAAQLISDEEMGKLFRHLDFLETDGLGLDHAILPLAIRLQFEFAGRRSVIVSPQWDWVDLENRRVARPYSKTGGMFKPLNEEAHRMLSAAPRQDGYPHVFPSPNQTGQYMTTGEYYGGRTRVLKRDPCVRSAVRASTAARSARRWHQPSFTRGTVYREPKALVRYSYQP